MELTETWGTEICRIFRKTADSGRTLFDELSSIVNGHSRGSEELSAAVLNARVSDNRSGVATGE